MKILFHCQSKSFNFKTIATLLFGTLILSSCQEKPAAIGGTLDIKVDTAAAISLLQTVNARAQACWMASKDKEFRPYKLIPELDTSGSKPRILLLKAKNTQGLPQLVIEAQGKPARLITYGPLTSAPLSSRINSDISRWAAGEKDCAAKA